MAIVKSDVNIRIDKKIFEKEGVYDCVTGRKNLNIFDHNGVSKSLYKYVVLMFFVIDLEVISKKSAENSK